MPDLPGQARQLPLPVRVLGIATAAMLLTSLFIYLGFPYDRVADLAAQELQSATGYRLSYGPVGASPGLLGPGVAVEQLAAIAPDGGRWDFSRVRVRPAWSAAWLTATPALHIDAEAEFGRLRGVTTVSSTPGFDGSGRDLDLTTLLAEALPPDARITGLADVQADVVMGPEGPEGPVTLQLREGTLSYPSLPMDVPFDQIDAELMLGGELTAEIRSLTIQSGLGSGSVSGTIGRGASIERAPIELSIDISANEDIRGLLASQGVDFGRDGQISLQLSGTLARPRVQPR